MAVAFSDLVRVVVEEMTGARSLTLVTLTVIAWVSAAMPSDTETFTL
jgi:hypothetical protein